MSTVRIRRLRRNSAIRDWVSQTELHPQDIILPYFVVEGKGVKEPIGSMPGVYHLSVDNLIKDIRQTRRMGIKAILLFGIPKFKDDLGSSACEKNGIVQKAVIAIKKRFKDLIVITDVCLCGYTSHGHCGIIKEKPGTRPISDGCPEKPEFEIDNDETLKILAKIALSHAEAGADLVGPSAMMDGQVKTIRESLDKNGFKDVGILAYSAKYASSFYGPFREALDSSPQFGDRKTYQMDYRNSDEALREIKQDIDEGADIVMVKPALAYLDIIYRAKEKFNIPVAAYNVSGEYSMIKTYCQRTENGEQRKKMEKGMVLEIVTAIKRAGADFIITYHAKEIAGWLRNF